MERLERSEHLEILDTHIKGITVKVFWQFIAGWTGIVFVILATYWNLKDEIQNSNSSQDRVNAIQDIKLDQLKRDGELRDLQIKDLNERFNEYKSQKQ